MCVLLCFITANPTWGDIFESSKLKAQSSNFSFATSQWKETLKLWALSFWNSIRKCHPKLVCSWKIDVWRRAKVLTFFGRSGEDSENLLSKDLFSTPSCPRVAKRHLFYTFVPQTPSLESWAIHPIEKRTCFRSFLHLQNPDEFEEGVHIKIIFPEFIYWHRFCSKPQKRPVPVQTWNFEEQTKVGLVLGNRYCERLPGWLITVLNLVTTVERSLSTVLSRMKKCRQVDLGPRPTLQEGEQWPLPFQTAIPSGND